MSVKQKSSNSSIIIFVTSCCEHLFGSFKKCTTAPNGYQSLPIDSCFLYPITSYYYYYHESLYFYGPV